MLDHIVEDDEIVLLRRRVQELQCVRLTNDESVRGAEINILPAQIYSARIPVSQFRAEREKLAQTAPDFENRRVAVRGKVAIVIVAKVDGVGLAVALEVSVC